MPTDDLSPAQKRAVLDQLQEAANLLSDIQDRLDAIEERMQDFEGDFEQRLTALENNAGPTPDGADVDAAGRFGR